MPYTFPAHDLDDPAALVEVLGSFWAETYDGRALVRSYADGLGRTYAQVHADLLRAADCLSPDTVPLLHRDEWEVLHVRRSRLANRAVPVVFGGGPAFDGAIVYGATVERPEHPADAGGLAHVPLIFNRITDPSASLFDGLDYVLDGAEILFRADPFASGLWSSLPVFDAAGDHVDDELTMWLFRPGRDLDLVHVHFGYVLGLQLETSIGYRDLVRAVHDAVVAGSSASRLRATLAAVVGVPVVRSDGEVVEDIFRDDRGLGVLTDRNAYQMPAAAEPTVAVGDRLQAGDTLCDALTIAETNRGTASAGVIPLLALGAGVLSPGLFLSDLVFEDKEVPLEVGRDPFGHTTVRFEISGFPGDVEAFWAAAHARGLAAGATLAHQLDIRPDPVGEPTAASLPATINPLGFLLDHVLRGECVLIQIRAAAMPADAVGLRGLRALRKVVRPQTLVLILVEMPPLADSVTLGGDDDVISTYTAFAPVDDVGTIVVDGPVAARIVGRTCQ